MMKTVKIASKTRLTIYLATLLSPLCVFPQRMGVSEVFISYYKTPKIAMIYCVKLLVLREAPGFPLVYGVTGCA